MPWILLLLFLAATPFWEAKAPQTWTEDELNVMLTNSPWAQMAEVGTTKDRPAQVFLVTAGPLEAAMHEREVRYKRQRPVTKDAVEASELLDEEYKVWLFDNRETQIVVAVHVGKLEAFKDTKEVTRMEQETVMKIGRKKVKITGHFPPTTNDPYLRFAFPREVQPTDKKVTFDLYVPGIAGNYVTAEFQVKDMIVKGKLEI